MEFRELRVCGFGVRSSAHLLSMFSIGFGYRGLGLGLQVSRVLGLGLSGKGWGFHEKHTLSWAS